MAESWGTALCHHVLLLSIVAMTAGPEDGHQAIWTAASDQIAGPETRQGSIVHASLDLSTISLYPYQHCKALDISV